VFSLLHFRRRKSVAGGSRRAPTPDVPLEPTEARRHRTRRGGPRTPLPLILFIALAAGVGVAYVSQSAYATEQTYEATSLQSQQLQLQQQASLLDDQLARLQSVERVIAAAQTLGMRPSVRWADVPAASTAVIAAPQTEAPSISTSGSPLQQLVASLAGSVGVSGSGS